MDILDKLLKIQFIFYIGLLYHISIFLIWFYSNPFYPISSNNKETCSWWPWIKCRKLGFNQLFTIKCSKSYQSSLIMLLKPVFLVINICFQFKNNLIWRPYISDWKNALPIRFRRALISKIWSSPNRFQTFNIFFLLSNRTKINLKKIFFWSIWFLVHKIKPKFRKDYNALEFEYI